MNAIQMNIPQATPMGPMSGKSKTTRTAKTKKKMIVKEKKEDDETSESSSGSSEPSECGIANLEELALKEAELKEIIEKDMRELFNSLDTYGVGHITMTQIIGIYQNFNIALKLKDAQVITRHFDVTGEGIITYDEFRKEMYSEMLRGTLEEHLQMVFDAIDGDGDGFFDLGDIMKQFQKVGALVTLEEASESFYRITEGGDEEIVDFPMFKTWCEGWDRRAKLTYTPITGFNKDPSIKKSKKKSVAIAEDKDKEKEKDILSKKMSVVDKGTVSKENC